MKVRITALIMSILIASGLLSGCMLDPNAEIPSPEELRESISMFKGNDYERAMKLLSVQRDSTDNASENIMISPSSISTALGMAANGMSDEVLEKYEEYTGMSLDTINSTNKTLIDRINNAEYIQDDNAALISGNSNDTNQTVIANSLWVNDKYANSLNTDTVDKMVDNYSAVVEAIPQSGEGVDRINQWVSDSTNGMINSIVPELSDKFAALIVNALYFCDTWQEPFDLVNDGMNDLYQNDGTFKLSDGTEIDVEMIGTTNGLYVRNSQVEGFAVKYTNGATFMAIRPLEQNKSIEDINIEDINISTLLKSKTDEYILMASMPKFKFEYQTSLINTLSEMGLRSLFAEDSMDKILDVPEHVGISDIIHKTAIELNEYGTKASAITGVTMDMAAAVDIEEPEIKYVVMDEPFIFLIIDEETQSVLFEGIVNNPE